jgi:hypothetical protein
MKIAPILIFALAATPAFAAGPKSRKMPVQMQGYYEQQRDWRSSQNAYRGDYLRGPHVYSPSGRYVGSDPSPNVRQRMHDDDLRFRGQP